MGGGDELHVVQLLEGLPAELALPGFAPLAVDRAMAHHLHHCPYHLRLLKTWLMSGQELPESLHGQLPYSPAHFLLPPLSFTRLEQVGRSQSQLSFASTVV
uniref:Uncharacterized protein n=1 Tax=Seriola dumerili TaxID=41447 RepID=A0A3B4VPB2_SERDU